MSRNSFYVYIAGPFFNPEQTEIIEKIKATLDVNDSDTTYFSPKDDCLYEPGKTTPADVLSANITAMVKADLMIVVTDGKDPGTMFEAGWAYANNLPIIYVWLGGKEGDKFNIVLASTGAVTRNFDSLRIAWHDFRDGVPLKLLYDYGKIEYE